MTHFTFILYSQSNSFIFTGRLSTDDIRSWTLPGDRRRGYDDYSQRFEEMRTRCHNNPLGKPSPKCQTIPGQHPSFRRDQRSRGQADFSPSLKLGLKIFQF